MTNEELMGMFPECEKIRRGDIAGCVADAIGNETSYSRARDKVWRRARELYPMYNGRYDESDPEQNAFREYYRGAFSEWLDEFEKEFLARHGNMRSFEEACALAADKWTEMIFGFHIQDNGDESDTGGMAMMLGSLLKEKARRRYDDKVAGKFRTLVRRYYEERRGNGLYCDYHPDKALEEMLLEAGCMESDIDSICPWKTGIHVNTKDNSVVIRGYQKAEIL